MWRAVPMYWPDQYYAWLLIKLTSRSIVFSFRFFSYQCPCAAHLWPALFTWKPVTCHQASKCILSHHSHGSQACCSLQGIPDEYDEADINRLFSGALYSQRTWPFHHLSACMQDKSSLRFWSSTKLYSAAVLSSMPSLRSLYSYHLGLVHDNSFTATHWSCSTDVHV